jgi:hypothetical protein
MLGLTNVTKINRTPELFALYSRPTILFFIYFWLTTQFALTLDRLCGEASTRKTKVDLENLKPRSEIYDGFSQA